MPAVPVYLDYHATTPCDPAVVEAMLPWFSVHFGNASSKLHAFGRKAADAVALAREQVASMVGASPEEIIFTSGATESINLALKGASQVRQHQGRHIVTVQTEHAAVLDTCNRLEREGFDVTRLPVDLEGMIDLQGLSSALRRDTILVAVMTANNETGVIQDMSAISAITHAHGAWLFTDATQAVGKMPFQVDDPLVDMAAFSAHKVYGPKGAGALYIRRKQPRVQLQPLIDGGGHERGLRSGTLNVPGIVGFGMAATQVRSRFAIDLPRLEDLRNQFEAKISTLEGVIINGNLTRRLPTVSNLSFSFTEGQALHAALAPHLAVSAGSACASAVMEPSHVLTAMQRGRELAFASMRISLGRPTQVDDMEQAFSLIANTLSEVRRGSPVWNLWKKGQLPDPGPWQLAGV